MGLFTPGEWVLYGWCTYLDDDDIKVTLQPICDNKLKFKKSSLSSVKEIYFVVVNLICRRRLVRTSP